MVNILIEIVDTLVTKTRKTQKTCVYRELELNMHVKNNINMLCYVHASAVIKGAIFRHFQGVI